MDAKIGDNDQVLIDTIQNKLNEGTKWPFSTAIGNIGDTNPRGEKLTRADVQIPYQLEFTSPYKDFNYTETDGFKWSERLLEVGEEAFDNYDKPILEVWAIDVPHGEQIKIADIVLKTELVTSKFGDERLHFQHVRTNEDRQYWDQDTKKEDRLIDPKMSTKPEFDWDTSAWPTESDEDAESMYLDQIERYGCPFYWLFSSDTSPELR